MSKKEELIDISLEDFDTGIGYESNVQTKQSEKKLDLDIDLNELAKGYGYPDTYSSSNEDKADEEFYFECVDGNPENKL